MDLAELGAEKAQAAIDFITSLQHVKDPWHGVNFTVLPWQERILRDVYGTLKQDGLRQYKHVYLEIPKKQGKSELVAGIGLKQLMADGEHHAEVYICAADRENATIIFDVAVGMIEQEPVLQEVCKIVPSKKRIIYTPTSSFIQALSSESYTKHGLNVSAVLFDEIHAQPNRDLYDVMTFGSGDARLQPLYWYITTAGDDPDRTSIGWEVHSRAESILLGERDDPTWYPVIFGHDPENRRIWQGWSYETYQDGELTWESPELWAKVNPSTDHTVKAETMQEAYQSAHGNWAEERKFRWLRTNEWVKTSTTKWMSVEAWDNSQGPVTSPLDWLRAKQERLKGRKCYGGLDLSSTIDTTAFVLLFPPTGDDPDWTLLPWIWIPEENMVERSRRDKVPYRRWVAENYLHTTPGNVIDYAYIEAHIIDLRDDYRIAEIGFDPWNAVQTSLRLADAGLTMAESRQGYKTMSPAMKQLQALVLERKLKHGHHPVLRWMFGNTEIKQDENENIRPVKGKSIERIDGIVATINALDRAMRHEEKVFVYERRGMRIL